jgi:hypothetical protein
VEGVVHVFVFEVGDEVRLRRAARVKVEGAEFTVNFVKEVLWGWSLVGFR